jgi:hypothetical protein
MRKKQMKKTYKDTIKYYENGKEKELPVSIAFVSNRASREYTELMSDIDTFRKKSEEHQRLLSESGTIIAEHKDGYKDELKKNEAKRAKIKEELAEYQNCDIFNNRVKLITMILRQNGINDEKMMSFDFWDECVESYEMMKFLIGCMCKDVQGLGQTEKKK